MRDHSTMKMTIAKQCSTMPPKRLLFVPCNVYKLKRKIWYEITRKLHHLSGLLSLDIMSATSEFRVCISFACHTKNMINCCTLFALQVLLNRVAYIYNTAKSEREKKYCEYAVLSCVRGNARRCLWPSNELSPTDRRRRWYVMDHACSRASDRPEWRDEYSGSLASKNIGAELRVEVVPAELKNRASFDSLPSSSPHSACIYL